jgi:hypothetical protein
MSSQKVDDWCRATNATAGQPQAADVNYRLKRGARTSVERERPRMGSVRRHGTKGQSERRRWEEVPLQKSRWSQLAASGKLRQFVGL